MDLFYGVIPFFASVYLFFLKQIRDCPLHYAVKGTLKKYEEMVVM